MSHDPDSDILWTVSPGLTDYAAALAHMEAQAAAIAAGTAPEEIWLLEHPPLYTAGTSAVPSEMLDPRFPVFEAGRGGRYTYHGPGQRVGYVMLDLKKRGPDVRCFVHALEGWVIAALAELGVAAWRAEGRVGIWTDYDGQEAKSAPSGCVCAAGSPFTALPLMWRRTCRTLGNRALRFARISSDKSGCFEHRSGHGGV